MTERHAALAALAARLPGRARLGTGDEERGPKLATGLPALDERLGGLPRGRLSELVGPASSGKLSVLLSTLRGVLAPKEGEPGLAALVDLSGNVFPRGAWASGRLLVVRPTELPGALRALDLLVSSGSFEAVALEASGHLPPRGLPQAVGVRLAGLARETGCSVVACAERSAFSSLASLRLKLAGRPDGGLEATTTKSREGLGGCASLERPNLPWAIAAALREREAAAVLPFAAKRELSP